MTNASRLLIGWREWVSLPGLRLPVIKAKVDTGARTSSLHAFAIETFYERGVLKVRFHVHPMQRRDDIVVVCESPVLDYRSVSDSGGHREKRFVIQSDLVVGTVRFPIEITLANRETMSHRMLLGRTAMKPFMIEPNHSYLLGTPAKVLGHYKTQTPKPKARGKKSGRHE